MTTTGTNPENLLPLTPAVFHVLLALSDGERHGYAIMREVAEATEQIKMGRERSMARSSGCWKPN